MREEALKRIGHLYPTIRVTPEMVQERPDLAPYQDQELTVIAWLWARTVKSPNPAYSHVDVPLASTFVLSSKSGKEAYVEPVIDGDTYRFTVKVGTPPAGAKEGTKLTRGANFKCLLSDAPIEPDYIKGEGVADRMSQRLMAIVAEGTRGRVYLSPAEEHEDIANAAGESWKPTTSLPDDPRNFWTISYGLTTYGDLFTPRQLVALTTFSDLVSEAIDKARQDAISAGMADDGIGLDAGGSGASAYAEAVGVYLAFVVDKMADAHSSLTSWTAQRDTFRNTFARQALPMVWDYAEANPLSGSAGNSDGALKWIEKSLELFPAAPIGIANQQDAQLQRITEGKVVSTDPPYYDNIGYADLSDFFYVWLRRALRSVYPRLFSTLAVPKAEELVATPYRHDGKQNAERFFLTGMTRALRNLAQQAHESFPVTIYYAFKQSETTEATGTSSTGWETFLEAVRDAGLVLTGTWPVRTEREGRTISSGSNTLASSIVLVCRKRSENAETISRREFIRELNATLPEALRDMTRGGVNSPVAPVDLSQAIIGPGMAIFSRYAAVLEANGEPMSVKTALQLINRYLSEDDFDDDTLFCLDWFEQHGWESGKYGDADILARAKGTSVDGLVASGVVESGAGKLQLLRWAEMPRDWSPQSDSRVSIWEALHQLIRALNQEGESAAGVLLAQLSDKRAGINALIYRLYTLCERKGWAEQARAYNELQGAWGAIEQAARERGPSAGQASLDF